MVWNGLKMAELLQRRIRNLKNNASREGVVSAHREMKVGVYNTPLV